MISSDMLALVIDIWNRLHGTKHTLRSFSKFMEGQTLSVVDGQKLYYSNDVMRFLKCKPCID
jgi:hypothetical protein